MPASIRSSSSSSLSSSPAAAAGYGRPRSAPNYMQQQHQQQQRPASSYEGASGGVGNASRPSSSSMALSRSSSSSRRPSSRGERSIKSATQFRQRPSSSMSGLQQQRSSGGSSSSLAAGAQRLSMHKLKKQHEEKRRVKELHDYARAQHRKLVAKVRLANDCCRILRRPPAYSLPDDPMKKGIFDLDTPSTLPMRVLVRQPGRSQYGWQASGDVCVREVSVPLFDKELEGLQQQAAKAEANRRLGGAGSPASPTDTPAKGWVPVFLGGGREGRGVGVHPPRRGVHAVD
jgi:hypothetical protein